MSTAVEISAKILLTCFKYRRPVVVHDSLA